MANRVESLHGIWAFIEVNIISENLYVKHYHEIFIYRWDDVSRLQRSDIRFDKGINGRFIRVTLRGGKTAMNKEHLSERVVAENNIQPEMCLVTLTEQYLSFLGSHPGSLQPTCDPRNPNKPHETRTVGYTLALEDLRKTITLAG